MGSIDRSDQAFITAFGKLVTRFDRVDHQGDTINDGEDSGDQLLVRLTPSGAAIGQRVLGCMAEAGEAREVEEAAIALHGMDEAEDRIEPRAVSRIRLPRDEFAAGSFQHLAGLGDKIRQQIVHQVRNLLALVGRAMRQGWLTSA